MHGINGIGAIALPQSNFDRPSRRPGTPGHPGKHLGQFKRAAKAKMHSGDMPLILQILNALNANNTGKAKPAKVAPQQFQKTDVSPQIVNDALQSTHESISDSLKFTSRFNAISTAFF